MDIRDYLRILRKSWGLILSLVLVGTLVAATYSLLKEPTYSATAKVFVSTQSTGTIGELAQGNSFSVQRVKTYSDLVLTPAVLIPVIEQLNINLSSDQIVPLITASAPLDTSIIDITVENTDPALAADLANATASNLAKAVEKLETSTNSASGSPVKLTPVQMAEVPTSPVSPKIPLNIALGVLIGLALGVGLAVLRQTLDTRIHNQKDVEALTSIPVLGGIVFDPKAKQRPLIVHADPRSPRAEAFRTLRTNLQFVDTDRTERSFVITSTVPSEGKSTTSSNLAITLAESGLNVLLVEADLRKPKAIEYMGLEGAAGLTDVLIGRVPLNDVIQRWGKGSMYVLPAGKMPPNPSELLGSKAMDAVIESLNKSFDVVLYDCPPLLPVTDASILAKKVGGLVLIIAAGKAHKVHVETVLANLANVGAHVSGIILTMLPTKGPNAYGYGGYGYGYGYGYGVEPEKGRRSKQKV